MPIPTLDVQALHKLLSTGSAVLIDVREASEHAKGNIPGAVNIPIGVLSVENLPCHAGKTLVLHCGGGGRAGRACAALLEQAPDLAVYNLSGGFRGWKAAGFATSGTNEAEDGRFCELRKP